MDLSVSGKAPSSAPYNIFGSKADNQDGVVQAHSFIRGAREMLFGGSLNVLLVATPISFYGYAVGSDRFPSEVTFIFSLLALAPFAERLGFVTEQIALHTNDTLGGLLNATFGNATELIVAINALSNGLYRLVQLSLLGSILSNLLLVLGTALLAGGYKHKTQRFNKITSQVNGCLLLAAVSATIFPTVMSSFGESTREGQLGLSRAAAVVLLLLYGSLLYFQMVTHKDAYDDDTKIKSEADGKAYKIVSDIGSMETAETKSTDDEVESGNPHPLDSPTARPSSSLHTKVPQKDASSNPLFKDFGFAEKKAKGGGGKEGGDDEEETEEEEDEEEEDEDILGVHYGVLWLGIITFFIAILSDALVNSIGEVAQNNKSARGVFLASIVIPIVGNAAEHASSVIFAMKNKVEISLGVAVGSSTQIALLVMPLVVVLGWFLDKPMSLNLHPFESFSFFLAVLGSMVAIKDGTSNWLVGAVLMGTYLIIAAAFFCMKDEPLGGIGR